MRYKWHLSAILLSALIGCPKAEVCNNGADDDGNGLTDCDDSACTQDASCGCGNNQINAGEQCDGADLNNQSCVGFGFDGGTLACNTACQFDQSGCTTNGVCGDNTVDPGEDCDGNNLDGASCISLGLQDGTLVCVAAGQGAECTFDTSGCGNGGGVCGNNVVEAGEQCDDGNILNNDGCSSTCQNEGAVCGNNVVEAGEQCDDGNTTNGDGCSSICQNEGAPGGAFVINEVDYDQFNSDTASFVEIFNGTNATVSLVGLSLAIINGADGQEGVGNNARIDLSSAGTLAAGQFLVVGNDSVIAGLPGTVKTISKGATDFLQNGGNAANPAPDGILLLDANNNVIDALSYEGSIANFTLTGGSSTPFPGTGFDGLDTNGNGTGEDFNSVARKTDGVDTNNGNADWALVTPGTPGASNP